MKCIIRTFTALGLLLLASLANAQIQIKPLKDAKPNIPMTIGSHVLTADDAGAWLDGLFPYGLAKNNLAGAVVVVVKDGRILVSKGYGYADIAAKQKVDPASTLFRPGSISKTFLWTAVMQLVEQGRLNLDVDVNRYLDFTIAPRDGKPITMRDLMTHTPGFEETLKNLLSHDVRLPMSNEAWLKEWVPTRVFAPGEVPAYSNYGAALAGYIVQRISGQPFEQYIEQHIYQPLGMQHASFRQPLPDNLKSDMAKSYASATVPPRPFEMVVSVPAGGMSVSGEDMARFMIAQLNNGTYDGVQILRPETAAAMHDFTHYSVPGLLPMALGFYHLDRNGQSIIGHAGDTELFHSEMALFLQQNVGIFVSIDGDKDGGLRRQLLDGFADRYFPALPQLPQPTLGTARAHGALLTGRYVGSRASFDNWLSIGNLLSQPKILMAQDGTLITPYFRNMAGQPRYWREVKPFLWLDEASGDHLGALMKNGKVRWISFDQVSPFAVWMPASPWQSAVWNLPLLYLSLLIFLLTAALWPIAAFVRHRCGKPFALHGAARRWYRLSRVVAILALFFALGWLLALMQLNMGIAHFNNAFDGSLRIVQVIGVCSMIGTLAVLMNAICAWRAPAGWWRKINSMLLLMACFALIWFAFSLHLMNLHLNY
jgi:CubicO group peptidase (beta-lactamase class C family)